MRRTLTLASAAGLLALAGCASTTAAPSNDSNPSVGITTKSVVTSQATTPATLTADQVMARLAAAIPHAKRTSSYTEADDPNHLLGRPHEYLSKTAFKDDRVPASETVGLAPGDVQFGGSIEVFATNADATARSAYIQAVTASLPAAMEYDYVKGDVLVRVSHFLTPTDAKAYEAFANTLP